MSEIGATLQSARTRAGLDIADIEAETKIRAKYLRALEQEEWDQLPGSTYVRSFLRTYADVLGLGVVCGCHGLTNACPDVLGSGKGGRSGPGMAGGWRHR